MKKLALLLLLTSTGLFAQAPVNQENCQSAPPNYVLSVSGCVAPVTSTGGLTNFGVGTLPGWMTSSVTTPTSTPVLNLGVASQPVHSFLAGSSDSFVQPDFTDLDGSLSLQQFLAAYSSANQTIVATAAAYSGADMGASVANALAAAYTAGGGTVDARGFVCPTNCHIGTANLIVGDGTHPVTLLLPPGTIARDTISGTGLSAQIIQLSHSNIQGEGLGATTITGPSDVTAVQQGYNASGQITDIRLSELSIKDTGTVVAGSAALMIGGPVPGSGGGTDVISSVYRDISASGADIGVLVDGQHGCVCYDKFYNVSGTGASFGVKAINDSGYGGAFNSGQWYSGKFTGPIGLFDAGGGKVSYFGPNIENSKTNNGGGILAAQVTNQNGGLNYTAGDVVTPTSSCTIAPTIKINYVDVNGAVIRQGHPLLTVITAGSGCPSYQSSLPVTGGTGAGLKVDMQTSAGMVLLAAGDFVFNPYEEGNDPDWICGTGNFVFGTASSTNGAVYNPAYGTYHLCPGTTNSYGGPASNFVFGPAMVPASLAVGSSLLFGSENMFNDSGTHPSFSVVTSAPSGACATNAVEMTTAGAIYYCNAGTWTLK